MSRCGPLGTCKRIHPANKSEFDLDMTKEAYDQVVNAVTPEHQAELSHELIAAAASYEAMKAWNEHKAMSGETVNHVKAKEFLAAASGAFIDRLFETKGLDALGRAKAKKHGK